MLTKYCGLNERGKFGAHYTDIVIFVSGYFTLTDRVQLGGDGDAASSSD